MEPINNHESSPLVSICTLVYNHEPYLRECFDGFLMQKTNFAFEVLVHDDASTDGSVDIIREYTDKYPHIFKPIYQKENQYSKGVKVSATFQYPRAKGKYIAICEGDDYWTDSTKLQKQVDFLETHSDYVMCSHRIRLFHQDTKQEDDDWYNGDITNGINYNLKSLVDGNWFHMPVSVIFRTDSLCVEEYAKYPNSKDSTLFFHLLKKGKGYMMPNQMAIYRVHSGGVWSGVSYYKQLRADFINRLGIYKMEKSDAAANFIKSLFLRWIPRSWICQEWRLITTSFMIFFKHLGFVSTFKLFSFWLFKKRK